METASFLTLKRDDLIDMTHRLIGAVEAGFFHDRDRSLLVSMTGSFQSGKSLVVDTACDLLCADKKIVDLNCMTTRWQGHHNDALIEMTMMDVSGWNPHEFRSLRGRKTGGVNFIQNAPHLNNDADLAICIEVLDATPSNYPRRQQDRFKALLAAAGSAGLLAGDFVRFVSVRVNNRALLASPPFRAAFNALAPQPGVMAAARVWMGTGEPLADIARAARSLSVIFQSTARPLKTDRLPVYGRSFPLTPAPVLNT